MIAFNLLMFSALFATLDAVKLKNPKLTESLFQMESSGDLVEGSSTASPKALTWYDDAGLLIDGSTITKTAGYQLSNNRGWGNAYARSVDTFSNGDRLSWQMGTSPTSTEFGMMGLQDSANTGKLDLSVSSGLHATYSWMMKGGGALSISKCINSDVTHGDYSTHYPTGRSWSLHDELSLRVNDESGKVEYWHNNDLVETDSRLPSIGGNLTGWTVFNEQYGTLNNVLGTFKAQTCSSEAVTCGDGYDPKGEGELSCTTCANDGTECCTVSDTGTDIDAGASGDPHFRGFDGSQYDFQGSPGAVFNLITDEAFQLNARFVDSPTDGKTYMGVLGLKVGSNDILITPDIVVVNDASIAEGNHVYLHNEEISDHLGLLIRDRGQVRVKTEPFQLDIRIVEQEGFVYLDITAVAVSEHLVHPHGILGQTAQYMVDGSEPHPVHLSHQNLDAQGFLAGLPGDYVVSDGLFGTTFPFNHFGTGATSTNTRTVHRFGFGHGKGQEQA